MNSPWKTGYLSEALDALPDIIELAKNVLTSSELEEANELATMLVGTKKQKEKARARLMQLVKPPPKRPLDYCRYEIQFLPRGTRTTIRYLGDYIDMLVKEMTFEFTGKESARTRSLGANLKKLNPEKHGISAELLDKLERYNSCLYTPGKHDFSIPSGRKHRFTSREVVLTAFVTVELATQIKSISKLARDVAKERICYAIGGRWGSRKRVRFAGERKLPTS
jgi:hypothetical protein